MSERNDEVSITAHLQLLRLSISSHYIMAWLDRDLAVHPLHKGEAEARLFSALKEAEMMQASASLCHIHAQVLVQRHEASHNDGAFGKQRLKLEDEA